MKMVKSLLLGAAAGLVAMTGAQAADLPVKAKPVQYVKICSLYGAGFYYIPGTDTCIKIGGFARAEWNIDAAGSFAPRTANTYVQGTDRITNRDRGVLSFDVRSQSEYGTLRSYIRGGWQWSSADYQNGGSQGASATSGAPAGTAAPSSSTTYLDRVFIQLAGFTFGKTASFYDFMNTPDYSNQTNFMWRDSGGNGVAMIAYTAQLGNGLSASISVEDTTTTRAPIVGIGAGVPGAIQVAAGCGGASDLSNTGTTDFSCYAGNLVPDIIANLRIDQAWGSAQISGAAHDVRAGYYGATNVAGQNQGHPSDAWGYALNGGLKLNLPQLGPRDHVSFQGSYCSGAVGYCSNLGGGVSGSGAFYGLRNGSTFGMGNVADAYFANNAGGVSGGGAGGLELSKAYSLSAGLNHAWNNQWQTTLYSGYLKYKANSGTIDINCAAIAVSAAPAAGAASAISAGSLGAGCRDWSAWQIGSRTTWTPVANLDLSVEAMYHKVNSAMKGGLLGSSGAGTPTAYTYGDTNAFTGIFRVQRNFYP
jgi:hypothetical protein